MICLMSKFNYSYIIRLLFFMVIFACLNACDRGKKVEENAQILHLTGLSPYRHEFSNSNGYNRIDYFFTQKADRLNPAFRKILYKAVLKEKAKLDSTYDLYSIYVYEKSKQLDENFSGTHDQIRGVYDNSLISYSRWRKNRLDIFYIIQKGNAVFDLLKNRTIKPPFEFD